jgi:hypothetical protein
MESHHIPFSNPSSERVGLPNQCKVKDYILQKKISMKNLEKGAGGT